MISQGQFMLTEHAVAEAGWGWFLKAEERIAVELRLSSGESSAVWHRFCCGKIQGVGFCGRPCAGLLCPSKREKQSRRSQAL